MAWSVSTGKGRTGRRRIVCRHLHPACGRCLSPEACLSVSSMPGVPQGSQPKNRSLADQVLVISTTVCLW